MPLTPADVRSTQFRLTSPGYDVGEVDAFLDDVETELVRLSAAAPPGSEATARPDESAAVMSLVEPERAPAAAPVGTGPERALRTIALAEELAEQLLAEARAEAAGLHEAAAHAVAQAQEEAAAVLERASDDLSRLDQRRRELETRLGELRAVERSSVARLEQLMGETRRSLDEQAA